MGKVTYGFMGEMMRTMKNCVKNAKRGLNLSPRTTCNNDRNF